MSFIIESPLAVWKSILRHHPFFKDGGMFGWDSCTFAISYPRDAQILKVAIKLATVCPSLI